MQFLSEEHKYRVLARLSLVALYILLAYDLAILALGYFLAQSNGAGNPGNSILRDVFFLVTVADMIAIFIIKRFMLRKFVQVQSTGIHVNEAETYRKLLNITLVIVSMCMAVATYGLILVILKEKFEMLVLFVAVSLVGYQLFRIRSKDFPDEPGRPIE